MVKYKFNSKLACFQPLEIYSCEAVRTILWRTLGLELPPTSSLYRLEQRLELFGKEFQ